MKRVLVLGCGGAGKSTFAAALSGITGLPIVHLDAHHHTADWRPMHEPDWNDRVVELAAADRWIMDGSYGSSLHLRLPRADTVLLLDRHPLLCAYRVLRRRIQWHGRRRPGAPQGAVEKLDVNFLHYVLTWRIVRRDRIVRSVEQHLPQGAVFHHFTNARGPAEFLRSVS